MRRRDSVVGKVSHQPPEQHAEALETKQSLAKTEVSRVHHRPVAKPITFKDDQHTAGAMICVDGSGCDARAYFERLFELVRNEQLVRNEG